MTEGTHHHGPLAGLGAGAAAVLFAFGVLALAWHRVAGQVSMAVAVLAYAVMAAVAVIAVAAAAYVFLWVRHRARNPELLAGRPAGPAAPAAVEPSRVYLNVTPGQLAAIMAQQAGMAPVTTAQLARDDPEQRPQ